METGDFVSSDNSSLRYDVPPPVCSESSKWGQKVEIWRWSKFADSQNEEDSGLPPQAGGGAMQTRRMPSPQNC